jgi:hypothetical protein
LLTKGTADKIRGEDKADNLFAPIRNAHGHFKDAFDDIGDDNRIIAFPNNRLSLHHALLSAKLPQRIKFIGFEAGANCTVTHNALGAVLHDASLDLARAAGNNS